MTRVLLADDQELVRAGFRLILELAGLEVVGEAADGAEAVELARRLDPDVVLVDVRMPRMDGIEATRRLGRAGLRARVLVLTTFDLDQHVYDALQAGASGFLLKDVDRDRLVEAVRTVAAGEALLAPPVLQRLVEHFVASPPPELARPSGLGELSERELEVLKLIALGHTNVEIGEQLFLSTRTVETHRAHIQQKTRASSRAELVRYAIDHGLIRT
jgi:DNA-binding NarL/FixJ family response regulator